MERMLTDSKGGGRCVIWFGRPKPHERMALAAEGWQTRTVHPLGSEQIGIRSGDTVVELVDFRDASLDELQWVASRLSKHPLIPIIAFAPPNRRPANAAVQKLLETCVQQFPGNDLRPVLAHLHSIDMPAHAPGHAISAEGMMGESPALLSMRTLLHKYAGIDLPVLITGETGTGKELAAHALHQRSSRRHGPILAINCGAISSTLLQSELFGHEKGAFTGAAGRRLGLFESADGGTVFLDEVGDLPPDAQTSLLRVLQEGTIERVGSNQSIHVNVRIIAATHVDFEQAVETGRFRRDLYYRLNVLRLPVPALRDREDDIELLAEHFLARFRLQHPACARGFSAEARRALREHHWSGNVRELLNRVQRAAVIAEADLIGCADLELPACDDGQRGNDIGGSATDERSHLLSCLEHSDFNVSVCARRMRVSRVTVYRMCHRHDVQLEALRRPAHP